MLISAINCYVQLSPHVSIVAEHLELTYTAHYIYNKGTEA